jgi:hypothetical protein
MSAHTFIPPAHLIPHFTGHLAIDQAIRLSAFGFSLGPTRVWRACFSSFSNLHLKPFQLTFSPGRHGINSLTLSKSHPLNLLPLQLKINVQQGGFRVRVKKHLEPRVLALESNNRSYNRYQQLARIQDTYFPAKEANQSRLVERFRRHGLASHRDAYDMPMTDTAVDQGQRSPLRPTQCIFFENTLHTWKLHRPAVG